jgi:hypothetical protein
LNVPYSLLIATGLVSKANSPAAAAAAAHGFNISVNEIAFTYYAVTKY